MVESDTAGSGDSGEQTVLLERSQRTGSRREELVGLLFTLLICIQLFQPRAWKPGEVFTGRDNAQIAEAQAWWSGHMDLPERLWDTALLDGRIFSHFPPMFSFLAALVVPFWDGVPQLVLFALVMVPLPFLAYRLFWLRTRSAFPSAMLSVGLVCGTSLWPVVDRSLRGGQPFFVNQTLATLGLCILLVEYFGRQRMWLAAIGLVIAGLSRQITLAYSLVLLSMALAGGTITTRRRRILGALAPCVLVVAVHMSFNYAKFGNPLDNGYLLIYEGRDDMLAETGMTTGLFSPKYIPMNLYHVSLAFPEIERKGPPDNPRYRVRYNVMGTGIWWTTPLLLLLFIDFRKLWADRRSRPLLVAAGVVFMALMCYHSTGYAQRGYNRYSLDYIPALFAVLAPGVVCGGRRWIGAVLVGWSVVYFAWLI